jgi:hypothetical protein
MVLNNMEWIQTKDKLPSEEVLASEEFWIARDKRDDINYTLWAHAEKPTDKDNSGIWVSKGEIFPIPKKLFPEVTFENSPKQIKIEILK